MKSRLRTNNMPGDSQSRCKKNMDDLAERTKLGILRYGVHVIAGDELALIWDSHDPKSDHEKRVHVENFASLHGLAVYLSTNSTVGIFRKPDSTV